MFHGAGFQGLALTRVSGTAGYPEPNRVSPFVYRGWDELIRARSSVREASSGRRLDAGFAHTLRPISFAFAMSALDPPWGLGARASKQRELQSWAASGVGLRPCRVPAPTQARRHDVAARSADRSRCWRPTCTCDPAGRLGLGQSFDGGLLLVSPKSIVDRVVLSVALSLWQFVSLF